MEKVYLCKATDLEENQVKKIENNKFGDIAVYNLGGQFYATADLCTHATASLSEGDVEDGMIVCPVHWGMFHIPSGEAQGFPCETDLQTYPVEVEGEEIFAVIDINESIIAKA